MTDAVKVDCGSGVKLERGVPCQMSDGASLISDHYYPAAEGTYPTLLMRQPYGRDIASTVVYAHPAWFARHGYNVVIQDVRGRGDSEGEFYPFRNERRDGAETIDWLRSRPECNGKLGMYGFSYQGLTQLLAAAEQPEGLICIAPGMTACDLYHGWFYHNGALRLSSSLGWGLQLLKADARKLELRAATVALETAWLNLRSRFLSAPYRSQSELHWKGLASYVVDWFDHDISDEYWTNLDVSLSIQDIAVPALHVTGWFDTYISGSIHGYLSVRRGAGNSFARESQYLLAGPWIHIPWGDQTGEMHHGPAALVDTDTHLLRWFNHWLKGSQEFEGEPRIRHFGLGANRWYSAEEWSSQTEIDYFLHSEGRANSRKGDGLLLDEKPTVAEAADLFVYDPDVPVWAPGGPGALSGSMDQSSLEAGNNVLVYSSSPLEREMHVFGSPRINLYASTSAASADFVAKLVKITQAGRAEFICIGIARSSFLFRDQDYRRDEILCWEFELEPTSCVFFAGERVRLEIASSAFPLYDRNPSTNLKPCLAEPWNWHRSTQIVYHDEARPSCLRLPVGDWQPC